MVISSRRWSFAAEEDLEDGFGEFDFLMEEAGGGVL